MAWVEIYDSHNAYEWGLQVALTEVEPWGDDRDDLRAAVNTARIVSSNVKVEEDQLADLIHSTRSYLKIHQPEDD